MDLNKDQAEQIQAKPSEPPPANKETVNRLVAGIEKEVGLILGLPGAAFGLLQFFNPSHTLTIEVVVGVFLITCIFVFEPLLRRVLTAILPGSLSVFVPMSFCVVLAICLFHLVYLPRSVIQSSVSENNPGHIAGPTNRNDGEPWTIWEQRVRTDIDACGKAPKDSCLAEAISKPDVPQPKSEAAVDQLERDIRAGSIIMGIPPALQMLERVIGVKDSFLGDGFPKPNRKNDQYWDARVPEFVIRNVPELDPNLQTWSLEPDYKYLDRKLSDIIGSNEGLIALPQNSPPTEFISRVRDRLSQGDQEPVVVRFSRFPLRDPEGKLNYSQMMGRRDAKRVFVIDLGPVLDLTLRRAAELSGYSLDQRVRKDDRFWIWVYFPHQGELKKPTWRTIMTEIKQWVSE